MNKPMNNAIKKVSSEANMKQHALNSLGSKRQTIMKTVNIPWKEMSRS